MAYRRHITVTIPGAEFADAKTIDLASRKLGLAWLQAQAWAGGTPPVQFCEFWIRFAGSGETCQIVVDVGQAAKQTLRAAGFGAGDSIWIDRI